MKEAIILSYRIGNPIPFHEQICLWFCRKIFQTLFCNWNETNSKKKVKFAV